MTPRGSGFGNEVIVNYPGCHLSGRLEGREMFFERYKVGGVSLEGISDHQYTSQLQAADESPFPKCIY